MISILEKKHAILVTEFDRYVMNCGQGARTLLPVICIILTGMII